MVLDGDDRFFFIQTCLHLLRLFCTFFSIYNCSVNGGGRLHSLEDNMIFDNQSKIDYNMIAEFVQRIPSVLECWRKSLSQEI